MTEGEVFLNIVEVRKPETDAQLIAESIAGMFGSELYLPYAVDIDGQTMVIYDPVFHRPVEEAEPTARSPS